MGSLALLLWYTPHAEGEGGGPCPPSHALGRTPGPPSTSSHSVLMSVPSPSPQGQPWSPCSVYLPVSSMQREICPLPRSPSLKQECYTLTCLWEEDSLLSPIPVVTGALAFHFLTVN